MDLSISELGAGDVDQYESFLDSFPHSMIYQGIKYRDLIQETIPTARPRYLLARSGGEIVGALPLFVVTHDGESLVNSLPFYGSNGSFFAKMGHSSSVLPALIAGLERICMETNAITCTIITNPLDASSKSIIDLYGHNYLDTRTGQLNDLRGFADSSDVSASIMDKMHSKSRNALRKSLKSGFEVESITLESGSEILHRLHSENMKTIGGLAKSHEFFSNISHHFNHGTEYELLVARKGGDVAAALLLFYGRHVAEYFTPVIDGRYRSDQPLSALIHAGMIQSVTKGMAWGNWGGTWKSQDGVYRFKSRWGALDMDYSYLIKSYRTPSELRDMYHSGRLGQFPNFYAFPFDQLVDNT